MHSPATVSIRNKLRAQIEAAFPTLSSCDIFNKIKKPENAYIVFEDLYPFCDAAGIPYSRLDTIFSPYQLRNNLISEAKFETFYTDEFLTAAPPVPLREDISPETVLILRSFTTAVKARTSPHPSVRWGQIIGKNPPLSEPSKIRLATLCRLCDEYNLPFKASHFIDAVYDFFGKKFDSLNFEEFSELMSTFS